MVLVFVSFFFFIVYIAEDNMEIISLHHWLDSEANRYQQEYQILGEKARLPNELEFEVYWSEYSLPDWLTEYTQTGFYEREFSNEDKHFTVIKHPSGTGLMYIVFKQDADDYLDEYEVNLFYTTLLFSLIFIGTIVAYAVYFNKVLANPLREITKKIEHMPPNEPTFMVSTHFKETREIEQVLLDNKNDIAKFFQREQEFNRFTSHELRTPIMIINGSIELLEQFPDLPPLANKAINRIGNASSDMHILTEAFLLLGHANIQPHHYVSVSLGGVLERMMTTLSDVFIKQGVEYNLAIERAISINAPNSFVEVVMHNVLKNAFSYGIERIDAQLIDNKLLIRNRHDGSEEDHSGYGVGLIIVERVCERMNWTFTTKDDGEWFLVMIEFH